MDIVVGQEAVVPNYGLGRVTSFKLYGEQQYIEVKPYVCDFCMRFDVDNVNLVKINYQED